MTSLVRFARRALFAACVVILVSLVACNSKPRAAKTTSERIVSLSPSTTEAVFAVGAGDKLFGRSRYCNWPPEVLRLPQVGGYVDSNFEAILGLTPDLVVGARGPAGDAITKKLEARGIATYFPSTESLAAIDAMLLGVGARTDREAAARAYVDGIHARLATIDAALKDLPKVRVLLVFGLEPLNVAGPEGFPDEMLRRAGGVNVVTAGGAYPTIGVEHVLTLDPDLVINAAMAEAKGRDLIGPDSPGWGKVRAVARGHVVRLTEESVLRPGPRVAEGIAVLARAIHPEAKITDEARP